MGSTVLRWSWSQTYPTKTLFPFFYKTRLSRIDSQRCKITGFEEPRHKNTHDSSTETLTNRTFDDDDGTD